MAASPTSTALPRRASSPRATTSASIGYHAKKLRHTLTPAVRPAAGSPSPPFKRPQCRVAGSATTPSDCATASRRQGARRHDHHHRRAHRDRHCLGGVQLYVPKGRWLTGSLNLNSHLTLYLEKGVVIIGSVVMHWGIGLLEFLVTCCYSSSSSYIYSSCVSIRSAKVCAQLLLVVHYYLFSCMFLL